MTLNLFRAAVISLVFFNLGCTHSNPSNEPEDYFVGTEASPEYLEFERLSTANPYTGEIENQNVLDYLKSIKTTMGGPSGLSKVKKYKKPWKAVDDFFASLSVTRIAYDPKNTRLMYFCSGEGWGNADAAVGQGVWKSEDGGETWAQLNSTLGDSFYYCQDLKVHPNTSDVYVATRSGLYRSQDGGASWDDVLSSKNGARDDRIGDIEFTADGDIFVSIGIFSTDGIYYSTSGDKGSWERRMNGFPSRIYRIEMATAPSDADRIYACPVNIANERRAVGVYRSDDKGLNWRAVADPGGDKEFAKKQGWYDLILKVDPNNADRMLLGGFNLWRTMDGGDSWQQISEGSRRKKNNIPYVHVDQHEIQFINSDTVLFGNDGGIYRSNNMLSDTPSFFSLNENYNVTQFYACAVHAEANNPFVIGGTQDNGSQGAVANGISEFKFLSWADGSFCAVNHQDGDIFYTTTQYRRMYRHNHGDIDTITNGGVKDRNTLFINPIEMDPNNPDILYQMSNLGLWRLENASTADSTQWTRASRPFGSISAIGISKSKANMVYLGRTGGGSVFRIDNALESHAGTNPVDLDPNNILPKAYVSSISVDPNDEAHIVVTYSNYGVSKVWECRNSLDSVPTWDSLDLSLPDIPVRWALINPLNTKGCFIATEAGVMVTDLMHGNATKWELMSEGMANLRASMLRWRDSDHTLFASTHGRGIFEAKIESTNRGVWQERGPSNIGGRTRTIMLDPNDPLGRKLWAGSVSGGLWVAEDIEQIKEFTYPEYESLELTVFPNPSTESIQLKIAVDGPKIVDFEIYDATGQLVEDFSYNLDDEDKFQFKRSISSYRPGLYFLKAYTGKSEIVKQLMVY